MGDGGYRLAAVWAVTRSCLRPHTGGNKRAGSGHIEYGRIITAPSARNVVRDEEDQRMRNVRKARRSLISGLGVAAVGVAFGSRPLAAQTASGGRFQPARHQQDGWLDAVAGKHR